MHNAGKHACTDWERVDGWERIASSRCAAEIRAIAEAVQVQFNKHFTDGDAVLLEVVDWLDAEADRAEAVE